MKTSYPEILAPVADFEMCKAAVHNGADAVYAGMPHYNARGRTADLSHEELRNIIDYCHLYGVKVFLAFNILIFQNELETVSDLIKQVIKLSPDAFIVQDIGLIRLIKSICPGMEVHASTQMTVTNYEAINLTSDLGISRYVLGRENSISEIKKIRDNTKKELEVFVHGALCVSYSGQCLTSERIGGRSANRGQCAQSCRLPYDLIVDGEVRDLGPKRYLVSPQDLCSLENTEQLMDIGIESFKIEGRLKSPEYVAASVNTYRKRLSGVKSATDTLETIYSRGFFNGWMDGVNHQKLVPGLYSNHHGKLIGNVISSDKNSVVIKSDFKLQPGDGIVFCDFNTGKEIGSRVYEIKPGKSDQEITVFLDYNVSTLSITPGMQVFCNSSAAAEKTFKNSFTAKDLLKRIPLTAEITGIAGSKLNLTLTDDSGNSVTAETDLFLEEAKNAALSEQFISTEISSLSSTPFRVDEITFKIEGNVYIHHRELKELRRKAIRALTEIRTAQRSNLTINEPDIKKLIKELSSLPSGNSTGSTPVLNILIRDISQIEALEGLPSSLVYLDFEFGKEYGPATEKLRQMGHTAGIATTRILKPGETSHLKQILRLKPDCILVRNLGALEFLKDCGISLRGDFSLNAANSLTAGWLLAKGLDNICPSYDLNQPQLLDMIKESDGRFFEITVHQYMPAFHMEHCVFAAFLSKGSSYRDCGRPCEKHRVELRDHTGAIHPLKADAECRNTMFHGEAHSAAGLLNDLIKLNVSNFRFEALYETSGELKQKISYYREVLSGKFTAERLFEHLKIQEKYGVSEGQLHKIGAHKDRKKTIRAFTNPHTIR